MPCKYHRPAFWRAHCRAWCGRRSRPADLSAHAGVRDAWPAAALALESLLAGKTAGDLRGLLEGCASERTWACVQRRGGSDCGPCRRALARQALAALVSEDARAALAAALLAEVRRSLRRATA